MKKIVLTLSIMLFSIILFSCGEAEVNTLKVGMDLRWPPFETIDEQRNPSGISVDLAYELGDYLGMEVEIIDLEFGSLIPALETKQIDVIIGSMTITEERALSINFSDPYFYFPLITVLNKSFYEAHPVETKAELFAIAGVRYVGPKTFVSLTIPEEFALSPELLEVNDSASAVLEIITGSADAFIISASSAAEYVLQNPDTTVLLWDPIDLSPIGMGLRQDDLALLEQVNAFIASLESSGVYGRLRTKYDSIISEALPGQGLDFYIYQNEEE